jgi:lincosamide nucleotidyltransferase
MMMAECLSIGHVALQFSFGTRYNVTFYLCFTTNSMKQYQIIKKIVEQAEHDTNVSAVLMYGSFIRNEGDEYSDVEFYIFLYDKTGFDSHRCVNQIEKTSLFFTNEFGIEVAIFDSMIRGEFHFV